jgi:hypothetical protein
MPGRSNLNANSVDTEQIFDACVTGAKIGSQEVKTANIKDAAVTAAKLDPSLVFPAASIPAGSITSDMLAAGILSAGTRACVAALTVDGTPLTGGKLTPGTIPIGTIPGGAIITDVIAVARVAFDGDAAITIGRSSAQTSLIPVVSMTPIGTVTGEAPGSLGADLFGSSVKKVKYVANDTIYNAYLTNTTGTVGACDIIIFYTKGVMP